MTHQLSYLLICAVAVLPIGSRADVPSKDNISPTTSLPAGKWNIEFTNAVTEVCDIGNGGECTVTEPRRASNGVATAIGGSVVIRFNDDRTERWTAVGERFVVEHWFPGSRFPAGSPVLGIAERAQ